jgi:hypothetical protein
MSVIPKMVEDFQRLGATEFLYTAGGGGDYGPEIAAITKGLFGDPDYAAALGDKGLAESLIDEAREEGL